MGIDAVILSTSHSFSRGEYRDRSLFEDRNDVGAILPQRVWLECCKKGCEESESLVQTSSDD